MSKITIRKEMCQEYDTINEFIKFEEVKDVLGFDIDHSFLTYKKELTPFGWQVGKISLKEKTVIFNKL